MERMVLQGGFFGYLEGWKGVPRCQKHIKSIDEMSIWKKSFQRRSGQKPCFRQRTHSARKVCVFTLWAREASPRTPLTEPMIEPMIEPIDKFG